MRRIRVLIADVPQLVYDLLRAEVERYDDMEVVGPRATRTTLLHDAEAARADIVVLEPPAPERDAECRALLYAFPRVGALAVTPGQRTATLLELRLHETVLGDATPGELVAAMREQWLRRERET